MYIHRTLKLTVRIAAERQKACEGNASLRAALLLQFFGKSTVH